MKSTSLPPDLDRFRLVDEKLASQLTGLAVKTLQGRRWRGESPPYVKLGRKIAYRVGDLLVFAEAHRVEPRRT